MLMVGSSTDRDRDALGGPDTTADKRVQPLAPFVRDRRAIILSMKNDVVVETEMGLWHRWAARLQRAFQCLGL